MPPTTYRRHTMTMEEAQLMALVWKLNAERNKQLEQNEGKK